MTAPYDLIDLAALDLTSETGQKNALTATITSMNALLALVNNAGSTVPLLGTGNTGGLLTATQKAVLTGGPLSNADSLHTHSSLGGGTGGPGGGGLETYLTLAGEGTLANARVLRGVSGEIQLNDHGPGAWVDVGLAPTGAVAGAYAKVTIDSKGRVISAGALAAADLPTHSHSAADLTSGTLPIARYGTALIPLGAINPGAGTDGWVLTKSGTSIVLAAPSGGGGGGTDTMSNVGASGVGVFKQKTGSNFDMRNISGGAGILVTLDSINNLVAVAPDFGTNTNQIPRGDHTHDARYYQKSEVDSLVKVLNVVTKTANYTVTAADQYVRVDSGSGALTMTLPDATTNIGKVLRFKRVNSSANNCAIVPAGTDKIDAVYTSWNLRDRNEFVVLIANTGVWEVIDASYTSYLTANQSIGSALSLPATPTNNNFQVTATVNNGVLTVSGMTPDVPVHIKLLSGAGSLATTLASSGQGSNRWPGGGGQPATSTGVAKIDDIYVTYDGTDTFWSYRGQGF